MRTSSPGRLRSLLMDSSEPVLLLGAGASIASGIPAAGKTVEKVERWAWCENGRHPDDFTVRRSDYWRIVVVAFDQNRVAASLAK